MSSYVFPHGIIALFWTTWTSCDRDVLSVCIGGFIVSTALFELFMVVYDFWDSCDFFGGGDMDVRFVLVFVCLEASWGRDQKDSFFNLVEKLYSRDYTFASGDWA